MSTPRRTRFVTHSGLVLAAILAAVPAARPHWRLRATAGPSPRNLPGTAYDPARAVTVLFGGQASCHYGNADDETWQWDGDDWTLCHAPGPSPRFGAAMAGDTARGAIVLFGGQSPNAGALLGDTWELVTSEVGDLNCDGAVNFGDINPFILAVTQWGLHLKRYPDCDIYLADINRDGHVDYDDINPFVALLASP